MTQFTVLWSLQTHSKYFLLYAHLGSCCPYSSDLLSLSDLKLTCDMSKLTLPAKKMLCRQAVTALAMNGLQLGDRQIRVSMAKAPARSAPEQRHSNDMLAINLIQAQAQARLMQLPAFNMLLPMSGVHTNNMVKTKRPHQDPDKVVRTVFVENVDDEMDEQVCLTKVC